MLPAIPGNPGAVCQTLTRASACGYGERPDQYAVDHAEDSGVRADAQRQRQENGGRKRGGPSQAA